MTAEDIHADNSSHARENVIHEAGLFQGRLGFERAIILLEEGCAVFSNIHGLTHISFPKGNLEPAFEQIRQVLEREDVSRDTSFKEGMRQRRPGRRCSRQRQFQEGEACPKGCIRRGVGTSNQRSEPDRLFGSVGGVRRLYMCRFCGFSEEQISAVNTDLRWMSFGPHSPLRLKGAAIKLPRTAFEETPRPFPPIGLGSP